MSYASKNPRNLVFTALLFFPLLSCGQKDTVEEFDEGDKKNTTRSRLTDNNSSGTKEFCELPLDLGTILDPKRPGQTQTVLTTKLGQDCTQPTEVQVRIRSRSKVTLIGRFKCRPVQQSGEQVCTAPANEALSNQKNVLTIPIITDASVMSRDIDATATIYRSQF